MSAYLGRLARQNDSPLGGGWALCAPDRRTVVRFYGRSSGRLCGMSNDEPAAKEGAAESELHAAASPGDLEWVRAVVEAGANVNWRDSAGETALFGACGWGRTAVVSYLISRGAGGHLFSGYSHASGSVVCMAGIGMQRNPTQQSDKCKECAPCVRRISSELLCSRSTAARR